MRVTKKSSSRVIFFCSKSCKPVTRIYCKKKLHDLPQKKKITQCDNFFLHALTAKIKKLHDLTAKKKITQCDNFFLHALTAKIKKLHDLTAKKQLPILLKMHACRQCAHLWDTSDFFTTLTLTVHALLCGPLSWG